LALFYPETKGKTLEEMDNIFGKLDRDVEGGRRRFDSPRGVTELGSPLEEEHVFNLGKK
jgi:hypothetical protein